MGIAAKRCMESEDNYLERTQRNQFFIGGKEGQLKIRNLKIGIAGLGGMGSNIAEYLARLGVGSLNIADPDTIDLSNINRQVIANQTTVGQKKSTATQNELNKIEPDLNLKIFEDGITSESVEEFVRDCDFIVDEIDVFPIDAHYILHKKCRELNIPIYSSYVIGLGVHFYKFSGNDFTFEDFIQINGKESNIEKLDKIVNSYLTKPQKYLTKENIEKFKAVSSQDGVPIFGPSCLIGHSIVVTRILCDFLDWKVLGENVAKTPIMPNYLKIDFTTLQMSVETFKEKD
jgi:molybdopterin/thiamine biosynthesis adenylyltransferase